MRYGWTVLVMLSVFFVQSTIVQHMRIMGVLPNLALVLVVIFSIRYGWEIGICAAVSGGMLQDFFFGQAFGIFTLVYLAAALVVAALSGNFFKESGATPIVMIALATLCHYFILTVVYYFAGMQFDLSAVFLRMLLPELAYNSIVCWGAYKIIGRISSRFGAASFGR